MLAFTSMMASISLNKIAAGLLVPQVLHIALETLINKSLLLSVEQPSLAHLEQKTLTLELSDFTSPISFTVASNKLLVHANTERSDCTIKTSLRSLQKLKVEQQLTSLIKEGELDFLGDIKVAQQFSAVVEQLNIDWQSELANYIGDVPAHQLLSLGHKVTGKAKVTVKAMHNDVFEYLIHEKRLVVTHSEINIFNQGVSQVSAKVELLSRSLNKLAIYMSADSDKHSSKGSGNC